MEHPERRPVRVGVRLPLLPAEPRAGARPRRARPALRPRPPGLERGGARAGRRPRRPDRAAARAPRSGSRAPLRGRRGRRELARPPGGRHRLRRPGLRGALARRRPPAGRHRGALLAAVAVPVVRSGAAAHAHAQRPAAPPLRVHAAAGRARRGLRGRGARLGAARAVVHAGRRRARAARGLRVPRAGSRAPCAPAACCSPATPRTPCRRSWARGCARACATPRTSRGGSTSCCAGVGDDRLLDALHDRAPRAQRVDREPLDRDGARVVHARPARRRRARRRPAGGRRAAAAGAAAAAGRHVVAPDRPLAGVRAVQGARPPRRPRGPLRRRRRQGVRAAHPARARAAPPRSRTLLERIGAKRRRPRRARGPRRPPDRLARRAPRRRPCWSGPTPTSSAPSRRSRTCPRWSTTCAPTCPSPNRGSPPMSTDRPSSIPSSTTSTSRPTGSRR